MSVEREKRINAACAVAFLATAAGIVGLSVYQNYCANNAEAEVSRVVFWMKEGETALVTTSEDAGVEMQSEVRLPNGFIFFEIFTFTFPLKSVHALLTQLL